MNSSKLYIVATALGNRGDMTIRAVEILRETQHLVAEDTRECKKLLGLCAIPLSEKQIFALAQHNEKAATERVLEWLSEGHTVAYVSDRGTPLISDPGYFLVKAALEKGIPVIPIPGASSVATLLSVCPVPAEQFSFVGFLPEQRKLREKLFERLEKTEWPFIIFESPKRIQETLSELAQRFPRGEVFLGREMTKLHEEYVAFALADLPTQKIAELGEFTVLIHPHHEIELHEQSQDLWKREVELRSCPDKEWAKEIAARYSVASSEVYNALQKLKRRT